MSDDWRDHPMGGRFISFNNIVATDPISKRHGSSIDPQQSNRKPTMTYMKLNEEQAKKKYEAEQSTMTSNSTHTPVTLNMLVSDLIECDIDAWKKLPSNIRNLMLTSPDKFIFITNSINRDNVPDIMCNGIRMKYCYNKECWTITDIKV